MSKQLINTSQSQRLEKVAFVLSKLKQLKKDLDFNYERISKLHNLNICGIDLGELYFNTMCSDFVDLDSTIKATLIDKLGFKGHTNNGISVYHPKYISQCKTLNTAIKCIKNIANQLSTDICPKIAIVFESLEFLYNSVNEYVGDNVAAIRRTEYDFIKTYYFEIDDEKFWFRVDDKTKYFHTIIYHNYKAVRLYKAMTECEINHLSYLSKKNTKKFHIYMRELEIKYNIHNEKVLTIIRDDISKLIQEFKMTRKFESN